VITLQVTAVGVWQNARPRLKAGLNKWEEVVLLECNPAENSLRSLPSRNWWAVDISIPQVQLSLLFAPTTKSVDNAQEAIVRGEKVQ
jgi:hypothetical protein